MWEERWGMSRDVAPALVKSGRELQAARGPGSGRGVQGRCSPGSG